MPRKVVIFQRLPNSERSKFLFRERSTDFPRETSLKCPLEAILIRLAKDNLLQKKTGLPENFSESPVVMLVV